MPPRAIANVLRKKRILFRSDLSVILAARWLQPPKPN
jgi:hypothetical protein